MKLRSLFFALLLLLTTALVLIFVQTPLATDAQNNFEETEETMEMTATLTSAPSATLVPLSVTVSEPSTMINDHTNVLSMLGTGFTSTTLVRLVGWGVLATTVSNGSALTAIIPAGIAPGVYGIEIIDPVGGSVVAPSTLTINAPYMSPTPPFTLGPPLPEPSLLPTIAPPTIAPGQPSLVVRGFSAASDPIEPGETVQLRFDVVNLGDRPALGVSVSLDTNEHFASSGGISSATLPDLAIGASTSVVFEVVAAATVPQGPNPVPLVFRFRDFEGETYENKASVSVTIAQAGVAARITLVRYQIEPASVETGTTIAIELSVTNLGAQVAEQALVRFVTEDGALLPGEQGDTFSLGSIPPGATVQVTAPMIVREQTGDSVVYGARPQPIVFTWLDNGEAKQAESTITVNVVQPRLLDPLLLLAEYRANPTEDGVLRPGQRFTLDVDLSNMGTGNATEMLVTFGTVTASSDASGTPSPGQTTTSSTAFSVLNTGGTLYQAALNAGQTMAFSQSFIVSGTLSSGIYSQPITVRYRTPEGVVKTDSYTIGLVVEALPRVQMHLQSPLPDPAFVGEPFPLSLVIANTGSKTIDFTTAHVVVDGAEIVSDAEMMVGPIKTEKDVTVEALLVPSAEGEIGITVELDYVSDLNVIQTLRLEYIVMAQTPIIEEMSPEPMENLTPEPSDEQTENDLIGNLMMGFLGLGS